MSDGYRDPLAAALARVDQLERENAALKKLQAGRPATVGELEIVRLEGELRAMDQKWEENVRANFGMAPTDGAIRVTQRIGTFLPVGLALLGAALALFGKPQSAQVVLGVFLGTAVLTWVVLRLSIVAIQRQRARHEKTRAPIVKQIAALRGESGARVATEAQVRVAAQEERVEPEPLPLPPEEDPSRGEQRRR
jgi:hypothetical protein